MQRTTASDGDTGASQTIPKLNSGYRTMPKVWIRSKNIELLHFHNTSAVNTYIRTLESFFHLEEAN